MNECDDGSQYCNRVKSESVSYGGLRAKIVLWASGWMVRICKSFVGINT